MTEPREANDLLPFQLTVGKLRETLRDVSDHAVVSVAIPAGYKAHPEIGHYENIMVEVPADFLVTLRFIPPETYKQHYGKCQSGN